MMDEEAQDKIDDAGIRSTPVLEVDGELYAGQALALEKVKELLNI
jgi:glutaredoxin-like protein NrdH